MTRTGARSVAADTCTRRLAYRPPLDWHRLLGYLAVRAAPGVETVAGDIYLRTLRVDSTSAALVEVRDAGDGRHLTLRVHGATRATRTTRDEWALRARRLFDLDAEPDVIHAHLARDRRLRASPGLRVPGAWDGFELAVRAVLGQQISVHAATTYAGRLVRACGEPLPAAPGAPRAAWARAREAGLTHLYPTPEQLAEADLSALGLTRARQETLRRLAEAVARGELRLAPGADAVQTRARLLALPGVGAWTAEYIALRALHDPDAWPAADLGLRRALARSGPPPSATELRRIAEAWRPWRSYAAMALWMACAEADAGGRA